ncbi:MAG TPA: bifunctional shikimate kinase/3-dehydroquinate synthase [Gaiellaceae bacterium]|nr:bifunctional shikimate kinase/3-dehydroquinate synthase [Gaiellaceae bacterium]
MAAPRHGRVTLPDRAPNALDRHVALVGFMGAGKSTLGPALAERLGRPFVPVDALVEERAGLSVAELFDGRGEPAFRALEEQAALDVLSSRRLAVIEIGGGGLGSARTREALAEHAFTLHLQTTPEEAWDRVAASERPLARDQDVFRALFEKRRPLYEAAADGSARDLDGAVLAAAGVHFASHRDARGDVLVADEHVARLHGLEATYVLPAGEAAKTVAEVERLWRTLRVERRATLVAVGGGSTTDVAGFAAATYMRGVAWVPVPSTLVGQVDAAIGGKTGIDLPEGKNLVGAFHWPSETVIDTSLLSTLPEEELANGRSEIVKSGLLMGQRIWELELSEQVRRCAAFKSAVCLSDPREAGERAQLNLGHTFAHALEAASGYSVPHGRAVALGLTAALRLSGLEDEARLVEELLRAAPAQVDRELAWAALARDKKARNGRPRLVLLEAPGKPLLGVELDEEAVRAALDALIA